MQTSQTFIVNKEIYKMDGSACHWWSLENYISSCSLATIIVAKFFNLEYKILLCFCFHCLDFLKHHVQVFEKQIVPFHNDFFPSGEQPNNIN